MNLIDSIIEANPAITRDDFLPNASIRLQDDGDGIEYIAKWEHTLPIPDRFKVGK
jgi:hypothetical protein